MSPAAQQILQSFDDLHREEQQDLVREILWRTRALDLSPLSDDELVISAEAVFLELDQRETDDGEI